LEVYAVSGKVLTPFFAMVLLLSMVPNLVSNQSAVLQRSNVHGIWQDLFGSGSQGTPELLITSEGSTVSDMFLQITGIDGESPDDKHHSWIDVLSFSISMSQIWSGGSEQLFMEDIVLVKMLDKASPKLMEKCAKGEIIPSVVLEFCSATGDKNTYCMYELKNVIVSSFHSSGSTNDYKPKETITLSFEWIKVTYTEIDSETGIPKGNVEFTWALANII
jgi:type VI secretion system secreted protein Hcp